MALETENLDLDPSIVRKGVETVFDHPEKGFYLVAESENEVIASLMITKEWSDWRAQTVWWIQSLYVLPRFRKQGVFRMMYQHLVEQVKADGQIAGIRLYVDHSNVSAQKVYEAIGMDGDHYRFYEWMV